MRPYVIRMPTLYDATRPYKGASPQKAPLSQKGGWGDSPLQHHSTRHRPTVIPVKAGIHTTPLATPGFTGALDSGLRRNDGGMAGGGSCLPGCRIGIKSPQPPFCERGAFCWLAPTPGHRPSFHTPPSSFRRRPESGTPVSPELRKGRGVDSRFRGNDGEGVRAIGRCLAYSDSPSPNPLPLGEGFPAAGRLFPPPRQPVTRNS